ncbi:MAG TPA: T9SS type A sorting domain-containing protein, partial [Bacteroidia bacterium]|nr:T9SS type A sorting domain-containing protein [Bacteroidia bacterium]
LVSDALKQREVTISIYNLPGELVYREKVTPNTNSIRVPIPAALANGVYLVNCVTATGVIHARLVVER